MGRRARGMTLIELLVAMAIFSLVMTLVSQAVSQVGHVVRVADDASRELEGRWSRGGAASLAFANLVAPREAGDRPFLGRPDAVEGASTQPLEAADLGVGPLVLQLRPAPDGAGRTVLEARFGGGAGGGPLVWRTVAVFEGRAEFAFRNRAGDWGGQWPPLTAAAPEALPSAVLVRSADDGHLLMAYAVLASEAVQQAPNTSPIQSSQP